jgi:hypothetical protein
MTYAVICTGEYSDEFLILKTFPFLFSAKKYFRSCIRASGSSNLTEQFIKDYPIPESQASVFTSHFPDIIAQWIDTENLDFQSGCAIIRFTK